MEDNPFVTDPHKRKYQRSGVVDDTRGDFDDNDEEQSYSEGSDDSENLSEEHAAVEDSVREEMIKLEQMFKGMGLKYRMIDRIGEGTFSTVYKAEDLHYDYYENDWDAEKENVPRWVSPPVKSRKMNGSHGSASQRRREPRYVAIKKIYVTSSPMRIHNELELLHDLRGQKSVCPLITAFRHHDQVVAVLPYFRHQDFRMFYKAMTPYQIRTYFRSLFTALNAVHKHGIIHRDIKPTNFLYDIQRKQGVLVDFGLAEREGTDSSHCLCQDPASTRRTKIELSKAATQPSPTGYPKNDNRSSRRANRAGTRGFRAPEVLLKCTAQTPKIDIWSAGVILLTILAQRFPFFNSADDVEAIIEIASIFGLKRMKHCAILHGGVFDSNIPTIGNQGFSLEHIVQWSVSSSRPDEKEDLGDEIRECVEFLKLLLELDPRKRTSARAALASEFLRVEEESEGEGDEMEVL